MDFKKDNFTTILIIAVLALGIFYLLGSSNSNFTNVKKSNNKSINRMSPINKSVNKTNKVDVKEHLDAGASITDPTILSLGAPDKTGKPVTNDVPVQPASPAEVPSDIPPSVLASATANKMFPTGQFKPLLLTPASDVMPIAVDTSNATIGSDYTLGVDQNIANPSGRNMQTSTELRPQEMNSGWFNSPYDRDNQLNIENGNLLASATGQAQIGIDTVGQSLRNASYDMRGSVPIPKFDIGPFNNSTIEYDYNIKSLY